MSNKVFVAVGFLALSMVGSTASENTTHSPNVVRRVSLVLLPHKHAVESLVHRVAQDPYCPGGISACGQFCNDIDAGKIDCDSSAVPCYYDTEGHCDCVLADKCQ